MRSRVTLALSAILPASAACSTAPEARFDSIDPQSRTAAILRAAERGDRSAIPDLIQRLDAADPAERMLAIRTLERLTNRTRGYRHSDPAPIREEAIERWVLWWRSARHAEETGRLSEAPDDGRGEGPDRPSNGRGGVEGDRLAESFEADGNEG